MTCKTDEKYSNPIPDAEIKVLPVSRQEFAAVWPHAAPHLLKGLTAATNVTLRQVVAGIVAGEDVLWVVIERNATVAAFLTSTCIDDETGEKFVWVFGLGGFGMPRWAKALEEAVTAFGVQAGANSVRFAGRDAWSRVLPACQIIGREFGRNASYERAVGP